jgi:hypothetical protein
MLYISKFTKTSEKPSAIVYYNPYFIIGKRRELLQQDNSGLSLGLTWKFPLRRPPMSPHKQG